MANVAQPAVLATLNQARRDGRIALIPFIAGGFPSLDVTRLVLPAMEAAGATAIEIGFPFTDPIADGPVIQAAFTAALAKGITTDQVFSAISSSPSATPSATPSAAPPSCPRIAMISYSIVYRYGLDRFLSSCKKAQIDSLILPDLPPPQAQETCQRIRAAGLGTILLIAPTTSPQRRKEIVSLCSSFVYYLSVSGITGERADFPPDLHDNLRALRDLTDLPICVGFGIHKAQHLRQLTGIADGAIVGTAIVRRMTDAAGAAPAKADPATIANAAADLCRELLK
jgi:tryptophan synthase alpha chain